MEAWLDGLFRYLWGPAYTVHCLEVAADPLRALAWIGCNAAVAFAYFGIPYEIWVWARAMRLSLSSSIAFRFIAFIVWCGVSHVAMILVMPTTSWLFIGFIFAPLAVVSINVYLGVRRDRQRIVDVLSMARELLTAARAAQRARQRS